MPSTHKKVVVRKMDRDSINGHVAPANFVREVGTGALFRDAGAGPLFRDLGPGLLFRDSDAGTPVGGGTEARLRAGKAPLLGESDATALFRAVVTRTL
jgi:hypothetical protein